MYCTILLLSFVHPYTSTSCGPTRFFPANAFLFALPPPSPLPPPRPPRPPLPPLPPPRPPPPLSYAILVHADDAPRALRDVSGHPPRVRDEPLRDVLQLRDPGLYVPPVRVVVLRLLGDVELVHPAPGQPRGADPVPPVRRAVVVDQRALEVLRAEPPVHARVEAQPARDVLPAAIGHEPGRRELAHVGVHEREAGLALLPRLERGGVVAPRARAAGPRPAAARGAVRREDGVAVLLRKVDEKIAPDQFEDEPVRALVLHALALVLSNLAVDVSRGHAPVREPRRQLAAVVAAEHAVPGFKVRLDFFALPHVILDARQSRRLAAFERQHRVRVRRRLGARSFVLGREREVVERRFVFQNARVDGRFRERQRARFRRRSRRANRRLRLHLVPKRREPVRDVRRVGVERDVVDVVHRAVPHRAHRVFGVRDLHRGGDRRVHASLLLVHLFLRRRGRRGVNGGVGGSGLAARERRNETKRNGQSLRRDGSTSERRRSAVMNTFSSAASDGGTTTAGTGRRTGGRRGERATSTPHLRQDDVRPPLQQIPRDDVLGLPDRDEQVAPDVAQRSLEVEHGLEQESRAAAASLGRPPRARRERPRIEAEHREDVHVAAPARDERARGVDDEVIAQAEVRAAEPQEHARGRGVVCGHLARRRRRRRERGRGGRRRAADEDRGGEAARGRAATGGVTRRVVRG
eukprot:30173-Pelagococcus_subviridis.AAC.1